MRRQLNNQGENEFISKQGKAVKNRRTRQKKKRWIKIGILLSIFLCFVVILIFQIPKFRHQNEAVAIALNANETTMIQGESLPVFSATAKGSGSQKDIILNRRTKYSVGDLLDDLNKGKDYVISTGTDGSEEGTYPVEIELSDKLKNRMDSEWDGQVSITVKGSQLTVLNPIGDWEGDQFKRRDGTYVKNDFLTFKEKTYYFDSNGRKVTGWQNIGEKRYHFNDAGELEKAAWVKDAENTYYVDSEGTMVTGWQELSDAAYYFDDNGIMLTGTQEIGVFQCVFGDDGKLISKESKVVTEKPMIALTFDDGPGPRTHELLDVLEKNNAHATFFMQGKNVLTYSSDVKRMKELGCEIGNHSYDHPQLTKQGDGGAGQVSKTNQLLQQACGQSATVLRPPYGAVNAQVKASVGMPMILWNVDTLDWKTRNAQSTVDSVMTTLKDGNIVLMHDIHTESVDAAIQMIPQLIEKGYQLVTVSELAGAKGVTLQNGAVYTDFTK